MLSRQPSSSAFRPIVSSSLEPRSSCSRAPSRSYSNSSLSPHENPKTTRSPSSTPSDAIDATLPSDRYASATLRSESITQTSRNSSSAVINPSAPANPAIIRVLPQSGSSNQPASARFLTPHRTLGASAES